MKTARTGITGETATTDLTMDHLKTGNCHQYQKLFPWEVINCWCSGVINNHRDYIQLRMLLCKRNYNFGDSVCYDSLVIIR